MENRVKLLKMMLEVSGDQLGDDHYTALNYSFMEFFEAMEMEIETYETLMIQMRHDGLIEIELNGGAGFERANVKVTSFGAEYFHSTQSKSEIGFR